VATAVYHQVGATAAASRNTDAFDRGRSWKQRRLRARVSMATDENSNDELIRVVGGRNLVFLLVLLLFCCDYRT